MKSMHRRSRFQVNQAFENKTFNQIELFFDTVPLRKSWWAVHPWHIQTGCCSWELRPENTNHKKWLVTGANASTAAERFLESCLPSHLLSERQFIETNQLFRDTSCIVLRSLSSTLELPPVVFLPWTDMTNGLSCQPYGTPKSLILCFSSKVNALNWGVRVQLRHSHMV